MKHVLAAAALLIGLPPATAQTQLLPNTGPKPVVPVDRCTGPRTADTPKVAGGARKLGEEPPAARLYTLYRSVDGCPQPIVLEERIGANKHKALPVSPGRPQAQPVR